MPKITTTSHIKHPFVPFKSLHTYSRKYPLGIVLFFNKLGNFEIIALRVNSHFSFFTDLCQALKKVKYNILLAML